MMFSFEDGFDYIDTTLQEVKAAIFKILQDCLDLVQPDWTTQLSHGLEWYNVTTKEEDEDPRKINILETKRHHKVEGLQIEDPDITTLLKTRQVNSGIEVVPKFSKIGDYWDDATIDKVVELLHEYQDLFPMKFSHLKGVIGELGVKKNTLKLDMKPVKKGPYHLNPKHKERVRAELEWELLNQWKSLIR